MLNSSNFKYINIYRLKGYMKSSEQYFKLVQIYIELGYVKSPLK